MAKQKMLRYHEVQSFRNVLDCSHFKPNIMFDSRGEWCSEHFGNHHPLILELACGNGDYTLGLAKLYPEKNIIGIDIKGERIWRGAKTALDENISNVRFVRGYIDHISNIFGRQEVDEIWITFPDPYLKDRKERKRLTHPVFLERYRTILKEGGIIHLKTDSEELFEFTREIIKQENLQIIDCKEDVYAEDQISDVLNIQTKYEKKHIKEGRIIQYISFKMTD